MTTNYGNEGRSKQQGRARHTRPIEKPTASNGDDEKHAASRRHRHGGNEQDPREKHRPSHINGPATASNRQQRPRRTQTETQPAIAPPHLSNERGAKRYDDRAERAERIASRHDEGTRESVRTRGRKQARHGEATTTRETTGLRATGRARKKTSHEQRTTTPRPACRKNGARSETGTNPAELSNSFSSPIAHTDQEPRRPIHHPHRAVSPSSPQTAGAWEDADKPISFMRNMKNPISE